MRAPVHGQKAEGFRGGEYGTYGKDEVCRIKEISEHASEALNICKKLDEVCDDIPSQGSGRDQAVRYHDEVVPLMEEARAHLDALEMIVDDQQWPMPKYRELLFIS